MPYPANSNCTTHGWYASCVLSNSPTPLTFGTEKADEVKDYIKWAVDHSFGVIDVNIPELITMDVSDQPSSYSKPNGEEAEKQAEKLATYLWENYMEPSDAEQLFFMGVGNAFQGIVKLLSDKGKPLSHLQYIRIKQPSPTTESVHQRVSGVIVFIGSNPVRPVHSNENPYLSRWYSQHSKVYVAQAHSLWSKTDRRMSRRYGKVERSPGVLLNEMLVLHRDAVFAWIAEEAGLQAVGSEEETLRTGDLVMSLEKPDIQNGLMGEDD